MSKDSNNNREQKQDTRIPKLHAAIWVTALFAGITTSVCGPNFENERVFFLLFAAFEVFLVFMAESSVMFLGLKRKYKAQNFIGSIFDVNFRVFAITPGCFIFGYLFYVTKCDIVFYLTVLLMGWLKYEISLFENNIEAYFVDVKPTYAPNTLML